MDIRLDKSAVVSSFAAIPWCTNLPWKKIPEGLKGRFGFENNAELSGSKANGAVPLNHRRGAVESVFKDN